jgi:hypothetical protein
MFFVALAMLTMICFVLICVRFRREARTNTAPWRSEALIAERVLLSTDLTTAEARVHDTLHALSRERDTADPNVIEAVTRWNWRSSGTVIRVALEPEDSATCATVSVWPGAQLFDWGESRRVAGQIKQSLKL